MLLFAIGVGLLFLSALVCLVSIRSANSIIRQSALWITIAGCLVFITQASLIALTDQSLLYSFAQFAPQLQLSFLIDRLAAFFIVIAVV